jgi:rhamnose utilization protein RhaD (predicted bifunctional aldolase and dehydrogenase)
MQSRWSDQEAREYVERYAPSGEALALRVYTSRLIGREPDLVMHGGGTTSVKAKHRNVLGETVDAICVKGSGWDLDSIEPPGLPAMALAPLRALRRLDSLSDEEMVNQQRINLFDATAPNPSVETLLHAFLPHTFIDHTHADAILALTNQSRGEELVKEALGKGLVIVPYVMPGFQLAKLAAELFEKQPDAIGMVLMKHGLFTFAEDARTSYERTIDFVDRAERFLAARSTPAARAASRDRSPVLRDAARVAPVLRGLLAGPSSDRDQPFRRVLLEHRATDEVLAALDDPACESLAKRGPLTPDHVIRTKANPLYVPAPRLDDHLRGSRLGDAIDLRALPRQCHAFRLRGACSAPSSIPTPA